ncbi:hypothetical protein T484DRAFT_1750708 [Baffinella frigidus]|nr:hypothetical protein T484DRAFT_1750708 [Cryptophyta sp. CCMP2293]
MAIRTTGTGVDFKTMKIPVTLETSKNTKKGPIDVPKTTFPTSTLIHGTGSGWMILHNTTHGWGAAIAFSKLKGGPKGGHKISGELFDGMPTQAEAEKLFDTVNSECCKEWGEAQSIELAANRPGYEPNTVPIVKMHFPEKSGFAGDKGQWVVIFTAGGTRIEEDVGAIA